VLTRRFRFLDHDRDGDDGDDADGFAELDRHIQMLPSNLRTSSIN
jgi:hypothetical protein